MENELKARTNQVEVLRIKNTTLNHEMGKVSLKAQQQAETGEDDEIEGGHEELQLQQQHLIQKLNKTQEELIETKHQLSSAQRVRFINQKKWQDEIQLQKRLSANTQLKEHIVLNMEAELEQVSRLNDQIEKSILKMQSKET
ncbi:uncharacterized protein LOC111712840, partial [Eurytemora carolleeae]|uniref:uncharacterized protein LOC111712840 n=1 Tax=Eurytemora carolleeae TaxID=1294199 RepID=UPI000C78B286